MANALDPHAAIVTTAMYDAYAIMDSQAVAVYTTDEKLEVYALPQHANTAVAQAAFRALYDVFPAQRGRIEDRLQSYGLNPDDDNTYLDGPIGVGNLAARNVVSRFSDELRNKSADFTARKPFSVTSSAEFHANAQGTNAPSGQTPAEWLQLAQTSFAQSNQDLGKAVKFYLFVGNAMLDSGIAAAQCPSGDTHTALGAATSKAVRDFQGHDRLNGTAFNSLTNAVDATTLGADPSWKTLGESTTTQVWTKANNYFQGIR